MQKKVSVIIRTKNEERWISHCLHSVFSQTYKNIEVVVVDNMSTDHTIEKAKKFPVKIIRVKDFLPGKAINAGIRASRGEIIAVLSGHCIPVHDKWLACLVKHLKSKKVAGVYGRQEPLSFSSDADKRDLTIVFGLDPKIQRRDPFFHNANSAFRRELWKKIPFDEKITNIEDRVWGQAVLAKGYHIVYEPKSNVYHYHGIHQDGNPDRCKNVVRIIESLQSKGKRTLNAKSLNIIAIVPVKGDVKMCGNRPLLSYTLEHAKNSRFLKDVYVATDNPALAKIARSMGAKTPFLRPEELSRDYISVDEVIQYSLRQIEKSKVFADVIVIMEETYPFRPKGFVDDIILKFLEGGFDTLVPVKAEARSLLMQKEEEIKVLDSGFMPRELKETRLFVSLTGLGLCTYPQFIRGGSMLGNKVGIVEVNDAYSHIEVRGKESLGMADRFLGQWWKEKACADL